ncbi:MAG: hypothetical protein EHM80_11175 [Nitrospiraceae bacterium]|nr:MAG: hypothetical protein EHM80_11175 [Nitrospiraceae bacterium]
MYLAAETRSFERAANTMKATLGFGLSPKTIERLVGQVGEELSLQQACATINKEVIVPEVAVVSCDGGRIRTRAIGQGPGVHDPTWRETKNASFEKMESPAPRVDDPCSPLPATFRQVSHVAKIAEKAAFSVDYAPESPLFYEGPKRILRTCLSSMARSHEFGHQMENEARRRRFHDASRRVFIGDGLAWNWSIWNEHFSTYTPILDFIHAVQYLYAAAEAWDNTDELRWSRYLVLTEAVWQGKVDEVLAALQAELIARGIEPDDDLPENSASQPLADAVRYLNNNRQRMDYPRYRRDGLPITSSPMESLIKQVNHRVKGTEMFWNLPDGAEAILQLRAAHLCEDGRLDDYLKTRPGCAFIRRPTPATAA